MQTVDIAEMQARIAARKLELGIEDTDEAMEAMRNKGGARTAEKRELLRRMQERALAAGRVPVMAYF